MSPDRLRDLPSHAPLLQDPGRIWPGKKMPGRMGGKRVTVPSLKVLQTVSLRSPNLQMHCMIALNVQGMGLGS